MKKLLIMVLVISVFMSCNSFAKQTNDEKVKQYMQTRNICQNLSQLAIKKADYPEAIKFLEKENNYIDKIVAILKKGKDVDNLKTLKTNNRIGIARLYYKKGDKDKALKGMNNVLDTCKVSKEIKVGLYIDLGSIYKEKGQDDKAQKVYLKAFKLNEKKK